MEPSLRKVSCFWRHLSRARQCSGMSTLTTLRCWQLSRRPTGPPPRTICASNEPTPCMRLLACRSRNLLGTLTSLDPFGAFTLLASVESLGFRCVDRPPSLSPLASELVWVSTERGQRGSSGLGGSPSRSDESASPLSTSASSPQKVSSAASCANSRERS